MERIKGSHWKQSPERETRNKASDGATVQPKIPSGQGPSCWLLDRNLFLVELLLIRLGLSGFIASQAQILATLFLFGNFLSFSLSIMFD